MFEDMIDVAHRGERLLALRDRTDADIALAAAERLVEVLGEAANRLSAEVTADFPGVPWRQVVAMRSVISHRYDIVDPAIVWRTLEVDVPSFIHAIGLDRTRPNG